MNSNDPRPVIPPAHAAESAARHAERPHHSKYSEAQLQAIRERTDLGELARMLGIVLKPTGADLKGCCPFHAEKSPSFVVHPADGYFKCFGCDKKGDAFALVMLTQGVKFPEAVKYLAQRAGLEPGKPAAWKPSKPISRPAPKPVEEAPLPVPNWDALQRYVERANLTLAESPDLQTRWLGKRGFTLETAQRFVVGFMPWSKFTAWPGRAIKDTWVLPIAGADGKVRAVKLHRENPPKDSPKCLWAPFGTEPAEKPRHNFLTLWPAPEWFDTAERIYLTEGELKALAIISAGRAACSVTGGSSHRWTPGLVARLAGRRVCIVYDDDNAGRKFMQYTAANLRGAVADLTVKTFGRKAAAA